MACFEFVKNNADALRKISSDLRTTLFGYILLATSVGIFIADSLSRGFIPNPLRKIIVIIGFLALFAAALSLSAGLFKVARCSVTQDYPGQTHLYTMLLQPGLYGCLLSIAVALPLALLLNSNLLVFIFCLGVSCSITLIVFGTANIASCIATEAGIKNLRRNSIVVSGIAFPACAIMITSLIAVMMGLLSKLGRVLGINGGQWQDIYIIAVAAILLLHAVFVFYFYRKLKARVDLLTP